LGVSVAGILAGASPLIAKFLSRARAYPNEDTRRVVLPHHLPGFGAESKVDPKDGLSSAWHDRLRTRINILAWRGFGVWSFVCQMLCLAIFDVVGRWWASD